MHHHKVFCSCLSKLVVEAVASVQALKEKGTQFFVLLYNWKERSLKEERKEKKRERIHYRKTLDLAQPISAMQEQDTISLSRKLTFP